MMKLTLDPKQKTLSTVIKEKIPIFGAAFCLLSSVRMTMKG
jgi:hypothetical protein